MKAGNKSLDARKATEQSKPTNVVQTKNIQNTVIINLLPVISMLVAVLFGIWKLNSGVEIAKTGILTLVLTTAATFYIRLNNDSIPYRFLTKSIIVIGYLISICLVMLVNHPESFCFWMIGGLLVSMLVDSKLGLLLHFNLTFILGLTFSLKPEMVILLLIMGVLMSLLAGAFRQNSTVIYAAIIILSTNITLAFAINNFIFETDRNYNYMSSLFSIFAVIVLAYIFGNFYDRLAAVKNAQLEEEAKIAAIDELRISVASVAATSSEMDTVDLSEITERLKDNHNPELEPVMHPIDIRTSLEVLCDDENALLQKIRDYSPELYEHSIRIGDLSYEAAKVIGANDLLAKAGGLYHEAGKIYSKNYIEENLKIALEYSFPNDVTAILKQHNIKYEKPTSVEAAIVMLSDNVVSTIEYIEKTEDHKFTTNKIIDNIFQMRLEKGTFDNSGLSVKDFKMLKEFYQKEFNR